MLAAAKPKEPELPPTKAPEQKRGETETMDTSRDGSMSLGSDEHRKSSSTREPEAMNTHSPSSDPRGSVRSDYYKKKTMYTQSMDTDSPSSYPKHVIVPSPPDSMRHRKVHKTSAQASPTGSERFITSQRVHSNVLTPVLTHEPSPNAPIYDRVGYRGHGSVYYPSDPHYGHPARYPPMEMDMSPGYGMHQNVQLRPKRWACDYCNIATFLSYEEACAHEETCASRQDPYSRSPGYTQTSPQVYNNGLGALVHASREVQHGGRWGPQPRASPRSDYPTTSGQQQYQKFRGSGHEGRDGAAMNNNPANSEQKRMFLAMSRDSESLSDRQCFVRTDFVEVFAATPQDVAARHSKGAQKLVEGQVGIRCIHCAHLHSKDRAERAVCYPSSISRIYQTVADMQRFHFEQCTEIPEETRNIYKSLKTTRPRGEGSPQTYWIESAKRLGLIDSDNGIRFAPEESEAGDKHLKGEE